MAEQLTLALAKGRLAEETFTLLENMGVDCTEARNPGRQLVLRDKASGIRFILVKPSDVPTYVDHGVADLGVVGKDTLMEAARPLYEVLDLGFGRCRLCVDLRGLFPCLHIDDRFLRHLVEFGNADHLIQDLIVGIRIAAAEVAQRTDQAVVAVDIQGCQ